MKRTEQLPTPDEFPDAVVVIFDGECRFCQRQVRRIRSLAGSRVAFLSLHDPQVQKRYPALTREMLMEQMFIVDRDGTFHGGAKGIQLLSRRLPLLWPLAPLLHIPFMLPLWQWCYMQVARRRYRLSRKNGDACETEACDIHFGSKQQRPKEL